MKTILTILIFVTASCVYGQGDSIEISFETVEIDTITKQVFKDAPNAKFKLDYYHTAGYSTGDRYWYEILIIDSLLILNFKSPHNDDWNYINYQKQEILTSETLSEISSTLNRLDVKQKTKGIPMPPATGYGADRLFIETPDLKVSGGTVYICVGADSSPEDYEKRISKEKQISTTIDGDYQKLFDHLKLLFDDLPELLESKNIKY